MTRRGFTAPSGYARRPTRIPVAMRCGERPPAVPMAACWLSRGPSRTSSMWRGVCRDVGSRRKEHYVMDVYGQEPLDSGSLVPVVREPDLTRLAEELVSAASDRGIALTGEDGLLTALTRQGIQSALEGLVGQLHTRRRVDP